MSEQPTREGGDLERLAGFLRDRDVPCQSCGYNLRGLTSAECPECGEVFTLRDDEVARAEQAMIDYLRDHDLFCRGCGVNLRGQSSGVCGACGRSYSARASVRSAGGATSVWNQSAESEVGKLWGAVVAFGFLTPVVIMILGIMLLVLVFMVRAITLRGPA